MLDPKVLEAAYKAQGRAACRNCGAFPNSAWLADYLPGTIQAAFDAADLVPRRELNAVFKSLAEERRERIGESDEARAQVAVLREALKWALAYAAPAVEGRDYSAPLPITKDKLAQARAALTDTAAAAAQYQRVPEGYVVMPVEPTNRILEYLYGPFLSSSSHQSRIDAYKTAMQLTPKVSEPEGK